MRGDFDKTKNKRAKDACFGTCHYQKKKMWKVTGWSERASQKEDCHSVCYLCYLDISIYINVRTHTFFWFFDSSNTPSKKKTKHSVDKICVNVYVCKWVACILENNKRLNEKRGSTFIQTVLNNRSTITNSRTHIAHTFIQLTYDGFALPDSIIPAKWNANMEKSTVQELNLAFKMAFTFSITCVYIWKYSADRPTAKLYTYTLCVQQTRM